MFVYSKMVMEIGHRPAVGTYWRAHRPLRSELREVDRVRFALQIVDTPLHASDSPQFAACKCLRICSPFPPVVHILTALSRHSYSTRLDNIMELDVYVTVHHI